MPGFSLSKNSPAAGLSRREFLKLGGAALAGAFLPASGLRPAFDGSLQGRVLESSAEVYETPSFSSAINKLYWKDGLLSITGATVGDDVSRHNRVWYQVGAEGFIHSSAIQPVQTRLHTPVDVPDGGALAEITVPYTDARWGPGKEHDVAYRYYYETTCWVVGLKHDHQGTAWYEIIEDKWEFILYMQAAHLRILPTSELAPLSPHVPPDAKRIEVHTAEQVVVALEWNRPVFTARTSTGAVFRDGDYTTQSGHYVVFHKRPSRHMARGNLAANGYDLPGVPWVLYFTEDGTAFHGTFWHNDYGRPRSHGCINLTCAASKWLYRWTNPVVPANEQKVYNEAGTVLDII